MLSFLFLSCATGTDPGECTDPECLPAQYALHLIVWSSGDTSLLSTSSYVFGQLLRPGDRVDPDDPRDQLVPKQVWLNGTDITSLFTGQDGVQQIWLDTIVSEPGAFNQWFVFCDDLPSLRDSIQTLPVPLRIVSLLEEEPYRISDGISVVLEGMITPDAPCSISLELIDNGPGEHSAYRLIDTVVSTAAEPVSFSPEMLRSYGFSPGRLLVRVQQQTSKRKELAEGVRSLLTFSNIHSLAVELRD